VKVSDVVGFERNSALDHGIEKDSKGPDIGIETLIAVIYDDLRAEVGGGSTLLFDYLVLLHQS
jgi:hypothetical protein